MHSLFKQFETRSSDTPPLCSIPQRLFYALSHSYPFSSNGYAVRSHGVAAGLVQAGCSVIAASRPGLPWDQSGFAIGDFANNHVIDGVHYVHTYAPSERKQPSNVYLQQSVPVLLEAMRVFKPSVVMAASNWRNALPAAVAARQLGLPFFYEVRGFWELSRAAREPGWEKSIDFAREVTHETAIAQAAQQVFTLNRFMRNELIRRGVARERIHIVPNGFTGWEVPTTVSISKASLRLHDQYLLGYIGSFNVYEGLEILIEALALLRQQGVNVALLLVGSSQPRGLGTGIGSCEKIQAYSALAQKLDVAEFVRLPGRIKPEQVAAYYELLDVVVIPRRSLPVCELVSPMKPLEAAAYGKRVLMSNVAPLADLADLYPGFSYFAKDDMQDLARQLRKLLLSPDNAPLSHYTALEELTWERNVIPIVEQMYKLKNNELR